MRGFLKYICHEGSTNYTKCPYSEEYYTFTSIRSPLNEKMGFNATCSNDTYFYQSCDKRLYPFVLEMKSDGQTLCGRFQCQQVRNKQDISLYSFWLVYEEKSCDGENDCQNTDLDEIIDCKDEDCTGECNGVRACTGNSCANKTDERNVKPERLDCSNKSCAPINDCDANDDKKNCTKIESHEPSCEDEKSSVVRGYFECFVSRKSNCCTNLIRSQTNCPDDKSVGAACDINGHLTSISENMICSPVGLEIAGNCTTCDDGIEKNCNKPSVSCYLHKHRLCDGNSDCKDESDETNSICRSITEGTCKRRVGYADMRAKEQEIPLAWLRDGVKDCTDGSDEWGEWLSCGSEKSLRFKAKNQTCENVYICQSGEPGFVELSELCDGIETCGNENEVCGASRKKEKLETSVVSMTIEDGLTKKLAFCVNGLQNSLNQSHNLPCITEYFVFPDHEFYGVSTKTKLILPEHAQNCDHMYGEQYVYTSCTGKCTHSVCPLKTIPRYEVCPGQFPKRVGTLANNKYLAFFTVSRRKTYTNRYFVCEDKQTCLDYSQVCDLVKDCSDGSDEKYCTNHFECKSSGSYIPKTSECDGVFDCKDLSDECNQRCTKKILQGDILKVFSWLIGVLAALANMIILLRHAIGLKRSRNAVVLVNKSLMILISFGDFLIGFYLITISLYETLIYRNEYCKKQIEWITSLPCSMIGVFSTIGSQISLFSMTGLSIVRIYVIWTSRSRSTSSRISITNSLIIAGIVISVILVSVATAVTPIMGRFEDFFVNGIRFRDELKIFIGTPKKETVLSVLGAYHGRMTKKTNPSWKRILGMVNEIFSHDFNYTDHTTEVKKVHFYGNDGVCLFKYFVDGDDPQKIYVWSILAINFSCFLFISVSYLLIYLITSQSSNATGNQNESRRMNSMNRKIAFIITTDFCCWIPFIIVCALHSFEVVDATPWYALFSMIILPMNSLINPFLYDNFLVGGIRKRLRDLSNIVTNVSAFSINRNSAHEVSAHAGEIEMQQVVN